jgi:LuxR family maltose regulon positive regulatory protein
MARCSLEFARREEAFEFFDRVLTLASQWKQWHWYVMADGYFARDLALHHRHQDALERIRKTRALIDELNLQGDLHGLLDLSEMFVRHQMGDLERLAVLVKRGLNIRYVEQMSLMVDEQKGRKDVEARVKNLPARNPRESIWKHLADAMAHGDIEHLAMEDVKQAMKIGSQVGARETFLRQGQSLGNLIIKVAHENPTVYNEELARAMAIRIKEREMVKSQSTQSLTKRELEILNHLATGRTLTSISADLHISQNTMKTHLKNLYKKLEADGRTSAVEKAKALLLL